MPDGVVKRWNMQKGFGFITPTSLSAGADVFVHQSALIMDGFRCLCEGELVKFELTQEEDGSRFRASSVTAPDGGKLKGLWADEVHASGTVARWRADKGFGFITPSDGGDDVFVHQSAIHAIGYRSLTVGEVVEYAVGTEEGGGFVPQGRIKATKVTASGGRPVRAVRDSQNGSHAVGGRYAAAGLGGGGMFLGAGGLGGGLPVGYAQGVRGGAYGAGGYSMLPAYLAGQFSGLNLGGLSLNGLGVLGGLPPQHLAAAAAGMYDYGSPQLVPGSPRGGGNYGLGYSLSAQDVAGGSSYNPGAAGGGAQLGFGGVRAGAAFGF
ncbi:cold-shock' DNA-binding domain-containing protein [Pavlovales sp. CCMP2436]|nr:cold-shock' DNA-binding domain-containing protein [Pavlovales sp. CCMP2436]